ncbi:hypothetical protein AB0H86_37870 [Streptomyces sp. NPDC050997]|uniref:hypothetical protein n=1 Tax=Streptomyces sp. NPDC050997 TaxID=3155519 RepID=UPI0034446E5F
MATLVALAVGGLAPATCGVALADDPGATATGGSSSAGDLFQQNTAQESKQNNNCSHENSPVLPELTDNRRDVRCVTDDASWNKHDLVEDGGARAEGGSSTASGVMQQNTAQQGRQNNNCANPNASPVDASGGGRQESRCLTGDASRNKHTTVKSGGAHAEGGSSTAGDVVQQNTAQEGRQNNNCANPNASPVGASGGGRQKSECANKDASRNKDTTLKSRGAHAEGGSSTGGGVVQQNTAQEGRQNNNCANPNDSGVTANEGRQESECANKDASRNKHTTLKGGGAHAEGGSATASSVFQQNTAQVGRQNNNCANPNDSVITAREGGRQKSGCANKDASRNKHTTLKGGGAHAEGGSATASVVQQNTAQEGRQNNNCADPNDSRVDAIEGGRQKSGCANKDASRNKHTTVKSGGAHAEGGSSTASGVTQQNTAQEGRQNNNCADPNFSSVITSGRQESGCVNKDASRNKHTTVKSGGAHAEGGASTGGEVIQQNTAQSGRQNNNCADPNFSSIIGTGDRAETRCKTIDHSKNIGTAEISGGAEAEGGSSALSLSQQNTAQEGRQNNNCGNPNNLTVTATGSSTQAECVAVDRSTNIGSVHR